MWAEENPHAIRRRSVQTRFSVSVWDDIIGRHLIGPYLLPFRLTSHNYLLFLQQVLPQLFGVKEISVSMQQTIEFQHDGATAHFSRTT